MGSRGSLLILVRYGLGERKRGRTRGLVFPQTPTLSLHKRERESSSKWPVQNPRENLREEREKGRRRRREEGEEGSLLFVDPGSIKFVEELDDSRSEIGKILLNIV